MDRLLAGSRVYVWDASNDSIMTRDGDIALIGTLNYVDGELPVLLIEIGNQQTKITCVDIDNVWLVGTGPVMDVVEEKGEVK